jgi:hypothetical protein
VETVQDCLGEINDHRVALSRFAEELDLVRERDRRRLIRYLFREEEACLRRALVAFATFWTSERQDRLRSDFARFLVSPFASTEAVSSLG